MVYIATDVSNYEVKRTIQGAGYAKLNMDEYFDFISDTGDIVDLYMYGSKVFRGIVRYRKRIRHGYYEAYIVGEEDAFQRRFVRRKVTPSMVGKSSEMDVADVVRWLVDNYSSFVYDSDSIVDTGYTLRKAVLSGKVSSILDKFSGAVGYIWYVEDGKVYFRPPVELQENFSFTNSNSRFETWDVLSDMLANDVHVFGARLNYKAVDYFIGDGTTTEFNLSYIPNGAIRVYVEGEEVDDSEYEVDRENQKIRFVSPPPEKTTNVTNFTSWVWRRKITVNNNTGSSVSSPVVFLYLNDSNFDFTSLKDDMSDIRFGQLSGDSQFKWYYLGTNSDGDRVFVVKLDGVSINDGSSYSFYMFYGYENAIAENYTLSDVLVAVDSFNYDGELDGNNWDVTTYWIACEADFKYYVKLSDGRAYFKVTVDDWNLDSTNRQANMEISPKGTHDRWIYWYIIGDNEDRHVGLNIVSSAPTFYVGYTSHYDSETGNNVVETEVDGGYVVLENGVYVADTYFDVTDIGSRELHAGYNIEVRYEFVIPIYANMKDYESIREYEEVSAELRMDWIRDFDTATLIASKYLQAYSELHYKCKLKTVDKIIVDSGVKPSVVVWAIDSAGDMRKQMLVNEITFKDGVATVDLGEALLNIYRWSAFVEHRVRQLETAGDENFFTPSWQR